MRRRVVIVTDPMCSWCWGMAGDIEQLLDRPDLQLDLMLGGINTHGTQPIGDYGRRYLFKLWREVHATTGTSFSDRLPLDYVHNSTLPCCAVEAMRQLTGEVPFRYLHYLQAAFFTQAVDINNRPWLIEASLKFGGDEAAFSDMLDAPATLQRVKFQFDNARQFGTQALPSVLIEEPQTEKLTLLAGGYVDAPMLNELINQRSRPPLPA